MAFKWQVHNIAQLLFSAFYALSPDTNWLIITFLIVLMFCHMYVIVFTLNLSSHWLLCHSLLCVGMFLPLRSDSVKNWALSFHRLFSRNCFSWGVCDSVEQYKSFKRSFLRFCSFLHHLQCASGGHCYMLPFSKERCFSQGNTCLTVSRCPIVAYVG